MTEFWFEKVGKKYGQPDEYLTDLEWEQKGLDIFLGRVLKPGEKKTVKKIDEISDLFVEIGLFTREEVNRGINDESHISFPYKEGTLHFDLVVNSQGDEAYRIQIMTMPSEVEKKSRGQKL